MPVDKMKREPGGSELWNLQYLDMARMGHVDVPVEPTVIDSVPLNWLVLEHSRVNVREWLVSVMSVKERLREGSKRGGEGEVNSLTLQKP